MSRTTKRGIDLAVPSLAAVAVGYYFIQQKEDRSLKFLIFVMLVVFVLLYAVTSQLTKAIVAAGERPEDVKLTGDKGTGLNSTTGAPTGFDLEGWVDRLKKDVYAPVFGVSVRDADLYAKMRLFGNDELIAMWNKWKDKYFSEEGETMTEAIADEWFVYGSDVYSNKETILSRLKGLGCR